MEICLVGHGAWNAGMGQFRIPLHINLFFYCLHEGLFDSSWESQLAQKSADFYKPATLYPPHRDFTNTAIAGNTITYDYELGHPGGIVTSRPYSELINIGESIRVQDGGFFAVKDQTENGCTKRLSAILNAIPASGDNKINVRWFACREIKAAGREYNEWKTVCRGQPGIRLQNRPINVGKLTVNQGFNPFTKSS